MNKARSLALVLLLWLFLVACGTGNNEDNAPAATLPPSNPNPEIDLSLLGEGISSSQVPRGLITNGGLTVVHQSEFVRDGMLYLAYVVRNDSTDIHEAVIAVVTLVDEGDFRLETLNLSAPASHVPPNSLVALQRSFNVVDYPEFNGLAVNILPTNIEVELDVSAYPIQSQGIFDSSANQLQGEVTNANTIALQTLVAHFLLYDADDNLLNVVPASLTEALPIEGWLPDTTIAYGAQAPVLPERDDAIIERVELLVYGYEYRVP